MNCGRKIIPGYSGPQDLQLTYPQEGISGRLQLPNTEANGEAYDDPQQRKQQHSILLQVHASPAPFVASRWRHILDFGVDFGLCGRAGVTGVHDHSALHSFPL